MSTTVRDTRRKPKMSRLRAREARTALLFVLPQVFGLVVFIAVPLVSSLGYSFTHWDLIAPDPTFIGLQNWIDIVQDPRIPIVLLNTAKFIALGTTSFLVFSLFAAVLTYRPRRFVGLYRAALFLPYVLSQIAVGIIWRWMLNSQTGPINSAIALFGGKGPDWLLDPSTAMLSIAAVTTWQGIGFGMTLYISGLQGVPVTLLEAARIDGAGALRRFWSITLPLISPTVFFLTVTSLIGALQLFDPVVAMTASSAGVAQAGGPDNSTRTIVLYTYNQLFNYSEAKSGLGYAAAIAWLLALITFFVTAIQFAISRRLVYYAGDRAPSSRRSRRKES